MSWGILDDEAGRLVGEYGAAGELIQEIIWFDDIPVAALRVVGPGSAADVFYIHTDHLNAPTKLTSPTSNEIVWRWDHDPDGHGLPNEDPDGDGSSLTFNLRFPGQYYDRETGLHYNYFRDYDPTTGRYIQSDPIGLQGGLNSYAYARGNPINLWDPTGLLVWRNATLYSNIVESGAYVPYPGSPTGYVDMSDAGGYTMVDWKIESLCECTSEGTVFKEFIVQFLTLVHIRQGNTPDWTAWANRAEGDHVRDFNNWANKTGKKIARERETRYQSRRYSSVGECQRVTSESLSDALTYGGIRDVFISTRQFWDDTGKHSYDNPNHRP